MFMQIFKRGVDKRLATAQSLKIFKGGKKLKLKRKVLSILITMSMLLVLLVPLAAPASASGDIRALTVPRVSDDNSQTLGTLKVTVDAGSIQEGDVIIFKNTDGYDYGRAFSTDTTSSSVQNCVYVPATVDSDPNGLTDIAINVLDPDDEVQIIAGADQSINNDFVFYIYMRDVDVKGGTTDDNIVTFSGPANTGFPKGTVTNATVTSTTGVVEITVSGADTSNNDFTFDLRLEETIAGTFKDSEESIVLTLPPGYKWDNVDPSVDLLWGDGVTAADFTFDDEILTIDVARESTEASAWDFTGFTFYVSDASLITAGAINAMITGDTDTDITTVKVGTAVTDVTKNITVFTVGSMNYTVNGVQKIMDVAPYINANDRAMLPVRFAANATGISDNNIFWNAADQSVTLLRSARTVMMVIGSTTMWINSVQSVMDTVPVIIEPGRTMLPIRYVAQALDCEIVWDAAARTITITQTI
jgi:Copper amine oxidase N-terminal domain